MYYVHVRVAPSGQIEYQIEHITRWDFSHLVADGCLQINVLHQPLSKNKRNPTRSMKSSASAAGECSVTN